MPEDNTNQTPAETPTTEPAAVVAPVEATPAEQPAEGGNILDKILHRNQASDQPAEEGEPAPPKQEEYVAGQCPVASCSNYGKKLVEGKCEACGYDESLRSV